MTFAEARQLVEAALSPTWRGSELATETTGYEDATDYLVAYGDARYINGGDARFMQLNAPAALVGKSDAAVRFVNYLDNAARIDQMSPTT